MWYVRPAKAQISLRIRAFGVSKLERRLHRLVCVYTCQNAKLLEITYIQATSKASDQTGRIRGLIRGYAGRTYHIVGNRMLRLIYFKLALADV